MPSAGAACLLLLRKHRLRPVAAPTGQQTIPCPADVLAVQWLLFEQGHTAVTVIRDALAALAGWPAGAAAAGRLSWHAIDTGRCGCFELCSEAWEEWAALKRAV